MGRFNIHEQYLLKYSKTMASQVGLNEQAEGFPTDYLSLLENCLHYLLFSNWVAVFLWLNQNKRQKIWDTVVIHLGQSLGAHGETGKRRGVG